MAITYAGERDRQIGFLVSNRTDQPLMVCLSALEVQANATWSNCLGRLAARHWNLPQQMIRLPANWEVPPHAEGIEVFLPEAPSGSWRARFVVLRRERPGEPSVEAMAATLRHLHLLPQRPPSPARFHVQTRTQGRTEVQTYKPMCELVTDNVTAPWAAGRTEDWIGGGLDQARDAMHAKWAELDAAEAGGQSAPSSK